MPTTALFLKSGRVSEGLRTLRTALGNDARIVRNPNKTRRYRLTINWGNSTVALDRCLNKPEAVACAVDKLRSLIALSEAGVQVPSFSETYPTDTRDIYLARTELRASGGAGIVVLRPGADVPEAPLYVKYVPKKAEYRVHVFEDEIIFIQQKKRLSTATQTNDQKLIRNHANGWVFCPVDIDDEDRPGFDCACQAVHALGLDFGAVDIIIGRDDNLPYVLEVNTAPGITSPTLTDAYVTAIRYKLNGS